MTNPHKDGRQYDSTDRFFATSRRNVVEARQKQDAISRAYLKFERLHPDLKIVAGGSGDLHMAFATCMIIVDVGRQAIARCAAIRRQ